MTSPKGFSRPRTCLARWNRGDVRFAVYAVCCVQSNAFSLGNLHIMAIELAKHEAGFLLRHERQTCLPYLPKFCRSRRALVYKYNLQDHGSAAYATPNTSRWAIFGEVGRSTYVSGYWRLGTREVAAYMSFLQPRHRSLRGLLVGPVRVRRFGDSGRASRPPRQAGNTPRLVPACLSFDGTRIESQRCDVMTRREVAYSTPELALLLVPAQAEVGVFISICCGTDLESA